MQSTYLATWHPGAVGVEHYRELYAYVDLSVPSLSPNTMIYGPHPRNLHLGGTPIAMTIAMVAPCLDAAHPAWNIARISPDSMEYEIAGFLLWASALDHRLVAEMDSAGWFRVPLIEWRNVIKPKLDIVRRTGMFGKLKDDCVYQLRKCINVTYRRDTEADWEAELRKRTTQSRGKVLLSGKRYYDQFYAYAYKFETTVAERISRRTDYATAEDWYKRRHHHIPKGSTSSGSWIRKQMRTDPRMDANDRPNKKSVFEALDFDAYQLALDSTPLSVARSSTKPEPGDKRRALFASNDMSYIVSSYASVHAEKEMNIAGAVARQSVDDFSNWIIESAKKDGYWQSIDLSDYNSEHELLELSIMNYARAKAWASIPGKAALDKRKAALWLASACQNAFIQFRDYGTVRTISGLYSGSRDTARDNTTKHTIDLQLAIQDCADIGLPIKMLANYQSGDDEDTKHSDVIDAAIYAKVLMAQNHDLNPKKQLAGSLHHEFLQVLVDAPGHAQRPLAAIVATLASGNWYVPTASWFQSAIQGLTDNWWECAARGLPLQSARRMATAYLDTVMRVRKPDGTYHPLEWWDFRSPVAAHPLWGVVTRPPPEVTEKPSPNEHWPSNATDAWLAEHDRFLSTLAPRKREEYRRHLLQESHGSAFLKWRQSNLVAQCIERWPRRKQRRYDYGHDTTPVCFNIWQMASFYHSVSKNTRPRDENELASRLGVDPQLISLAGGWGKLQGYVSPTQWANYAPVLPARRLTARCAASAWAFRSWASRLADTVPALHADIVKRRKTRMLYIFANNGAGKGWISKHHPEWKELDVYASRHSAFRPKWLADGRNRAARLTFLSYILAHAIEDDVDVILGQWPIEDVVEAARPHEIAITSIYYEPGHEVRIQRILKRGQDLSEIPRLAERWRTYPSPMSDPGAVVKQAEMFVSSLHN